MTQVFISRITENSAPNVEDHLPSTRQKSVHLKSSQIASIYLFVINTLSSFMKRVQIFYEEQYRTIAYSYIKKIFANFVKS